MTPIFLLLFICKFQTIGIGSSKMEMSATTVSAAEKYKSKGMLTQYPLPDRIQKKEIGVHMNTADARLEMKNPNTKKVTA